MRGGLVLKLGSRKGRTVEVAAHLFQHLRRDHLVHAKWNRAQIVAIFAHQAPPFGQRPGGLAEGARAIVHATGLLHLHNSDGIDIAVVSSAPGRDAVDRGVARPPLLVEKGPLVTWVPGDQGGPRGRAEFEKGGGREAKGMSELVDRRVKLHGLVGVRGRGRVTKLAPAEVHNAEDGPVALVLRAGAGVGLRRLVAAAGRVLCSDEEDHVLVSGSLAPGMVRASLADTIHAVWRHCRFDCAVAAATGGPTGAAVGAQGALVKACLRLGDRAIALPARHAGTRALAEDRIAALAAGPRGLEILCWNGQTINAASGGFERRARVLGLKGELHATCRPLG
mmetsp:Transcript_136318/g.379986  ORF Transcript_136318/g.379986 Transcript_136318/m.379986 type:complete len:337 (+) Transcript_136318:812-1822(+)